MIGKFALAVLLAVALAPAVLAQDERAAADALYNASDWKKAEAAYEVLTRKNPTDAILWFKLGNTRYQTERFRESIEAYARAEMLAGPALPPGYATFRIARSYAKLGDADRAIEAIGHAIDAGFAPVAALETAPEYEALRADTRFAAVVARARKIAFPCEGVAGYRQFDFWIGEWDVFSGPNAAGSSRVERILDGCVIFENWTSALGSSGKSFNTFDPAKNEWHQTWVDNSGLRTEYHGGLVNGSMVLDAPQVDAKGVKTIQRMTFTRLEDGSVRQHGESSTDDGKTWTTTFDLVYRRKG